MSYINKLMEEHYKLSDQEFKRSFETCTMPAAVFNHEAHLRLAWVYLGEYGIEKAENLVQEQLKKYVASLGAEDKYHTTLTVASIKVIHHFMSRSKSDNFKGFIAQFPQLKTGFRELIGSHYGFDIYSSKKARLEYLEPDLLPFE